MDNIQKKDVIDDLKNTSIMIKNIKKSRQKPTYYWSTHDHPFGPISQVYSFSNEFIKEYYNYFDFKDKSVLTVCGSGDQVLTAIEKGATHVDTFDTNRLAYYYLMLKKEIIKSVNYERFLKLYNYKNSKNVYKYVRDNIENENVKLFWDYILIKHTSDFPFIFLNDQVFLDEFKKTTSYLSEENYYNLKHNLPNSEITFKNIDITKINNEYQNTYDYINLSNIIDYLPVDNSTINLYKDIFNNRLKINGECMYKYNWRLINKNFRDYKDFKEYNPNIINLNNDNKHESVLIYKKTK